MQHALFSLTTGALLSLAYTVSELWFLGFVALVPLLYVLKNTEQKRLRFFWSFLAGTLYFGSVFSFLYSAHPITWSGIDGNVLSLVFITSVWILSVTLFSSFIGLWGVVSYNSRGALSSALTLASLWVFSEWAQATSMSLLWWGESGLIGPHWTFGFIGYALAEFPLLLSLSSLGGIYVLSFVVVFINGIIFRAVTRHPAEKQRYRGLAWSLSVIVFLSGGLYLINDRAGEESEVARIASIYTTFGPQFFSTPESESVKNMRIAGLFDAILFEGENPHIIILPENTGYLDSLTYEKRSDLVRRMSTTEQVVILDSHYSFDAIDNKKVAVLEFETGSGDIQRYAKQLLVPAVEYMPRVIHAPGDLLLKSDWSEYFDEYLAIGKGDESFVAEHGNMRIGALFCSEAFTSALYRESTQRGANLLINTASHSVLNSSQHMYNQVLKFSKVRAAENNRFFIQAGNSVPSFSIDNHGKLLVETGGDNHSILYTDALLLENKTIATRAGEAWVIIFLLLSILGLVRGRDKQHKSIEQK